MNNPFITIKFYSIASIMAALFLLSSTVAAQNSDTLPDNAEVLVNVRPWRDFSEQAVNAINSKKVDLRSNFKVIISGSLGLGADGKTNILKNPKSVTAEAYSNSGTGPTTIKFVQDAVLVVGDSGYLSYLYQMKVRNVIISVEQTTELFVASIRADQKAEGSAKSAASGLNAMFSVAKDFAKGDEQFILSQMKTYSEGKDFVLEFKMPRAEFHKFLDSKIAESLKSNAVGDAIK